MKQPSNPHKYGTVWLLLFIVLACIVLTILDAVGKNGKAVPDGVPKVESDAGGNKR